MEKRTSSKPIQKLDKVLRLAVEHSGKDENEESHTKPSKPDFKRSEFLKNALKAVAGDDFEDELLILKSESATVDEKLDSLDSIRDKIDDIDMANAFVKIGGITFLLQYIKLPDINLRPQSIYIVAEMAQNNEFCQNFFNNQKLIPVLISTMNASDAELSRSSIFAISSLIQNFPPGLNEFLRLNGIQTLVSCLKSSHTSVYIKAAYLIGSLSSREESVRDPINKQGAVSILLNNVVNKNEYDEKLEATLSALSSLSVNYNWQITKNQNADAQSILKEIIDNKLLMDTGEEIINFARIILKNMTKDKSGNKS